MGAIPFVFHSNDKQSVFYIYYLLFTHSSIDEYRGLASFLVTVTNSAVSSGDVISEYSL